MKVQMVIEISGSRDGSDWPPVGGQLDCSDIEGAELIAAGFARAVAREVAPKLEKAVAPKPEARKASTKSGS